MLKYSITNKRYQKTNPSYKKNSFASTQICSYAKYEQTEWRKWTYLGFCNVNPRLHGVTISAKCECRHVHNCGCAQMQVCLYKCEWVCVYICVSFLPSDWTTAGSQRVPERWGEFLPKCDRPCGKSAQIASYCKIAAFPLDTHNVF